MKVKMFSAAWCSACKSIKPLVEGLAEVEYIDVDTEDGMGLAAKHGVRGLPTIVKEDGSALSSSNPTKVKEFLGA